jgi:hypothetical protein
VLRIVLNSTNKNCDNQQAVFVTDMQRALRAVRPVHAASTDVLMQAAVSATSSHQRSRSPRQKVAAWTLSGSRRMTNERTKRDLRSARAVRLRISAVVVHSDCFST